MFIHYVCAYDEIYFCGKLIDIVSYYYVRTFRVVTEGTEIPHC